MLFGKRSLDAVPTLLVLAAGGCGWFNQEPPGGFAETQARISNAKQALEALGAVVEHKQFPMSQTAYAIDLSGEEITDETLALLGRLNGVGELDLSGSTISDEQMTRLGTLSPLWILNLSNTSVSDAGVGHLKQNTMARLDVSGTKVTADWVDSLKQRYKDDPNIHPFFRDRLKVIR